MNPVVRIFFFLSVALILVGEVCFAAESIRRDCAAETISLPVASSVDEETPPSPKNKKTSRRAEIDSESDADPIPPQPVPEQKPEPVEVTFIFRVGSSSIDLEYMGNAESMETLRRIAAACPEDGIAHIELTAQSSPEGRLSLNNALAERRAQTLENLVMDIFPMTDPAAVSKKVSTANWEKIEQMISRNEAIPHKKELIGILQNPNIKEKEAPVRALAGKSTYNYLRDNVLIYMRWGEAVITLKEPAPVVGAIGAGGEGGAGAGGGNWWCRVPWALKTNLLFDVVGAPNIGAEVLVHPKVSVQADIAYAFWRTRKNVSALQTLQGGIGAKYWFKRRNERVLTGWSVGVYLMAGGRYDVQLGAGYQGDRFWSAGASAGYGIKIAEPLNLEFSIAAGYFRTPEVRHYHRPENGYLMWQNTRSKFGAFSITKIQVNLVWLICKGEKR